MPDPKSYAVGRLQGGFAVYWWADGKRRRFRLEARSRKEAEAEALDVYRKEQLQAAGDTVKELWELYRAEKQGRRVAVAMGYEERFIFAHYGHLRPDQVDHQTNRDYVAARRAMNPKGKDTPTHDGTIWTEMGHLRTVMLWAVRRGKIKIAPDIERPAKPQPKDRWLTDAEVQKLLHVETELHTMVAINLMLATAGRVGAILELTWDRVDFERSQIDLRLDKTSPRKGRATVPMNSSLRAVLSRAKAVAMTDHVIEWAGKPVGTIKHGFAKAATDAGLIGVTPHVLRHTAAVHMAAGGIPMTKISQYLGHSSTAVTERVYARFAPDHLKDAAEVLDFGTRLRVVK
jgi:integrase